MTNIDIDWIERARAVTHQIQNFVKGRRQPIGPGKVIDKHSPRDGRTLYRFSASTSSEIDDAILDARRAFDDGRWTDLPVRRRADALLKLAQLIDFHREELALLECLDVGKPITDALNVDVPGAAAIIRYYSEAADKFDSRLYATDRTSLAYQSRRPVGVVGGIIGWNFPLLLAAGKVGPALATGNALILKPSELTSLSAVRLAELAVEAGIPDGVFNVIHGAAEVGAALAHSRDVDLLTFTGSTQTGKRLLIAAGESNMKRLLLECGGKAPDIVFNDCPNLDAVAAGVTSRAFWNQGQVCTASSRLLVQRDVKEALMARIIREVNKLQLGDPLDPKTKNGAVVSAEHRSKVLAHIRNGQFEGATVAYQGDAVPPFEDGFYVPATVFDHVLSHRRIAREEIFGPVLCVLDFETEQEAIQIANATPYGLSAVIWTKDLGRAHRVSFGIKAGWIVVNATETPIGGPGDGVLSVGGHRESGIGVEGGIDGLLGYTTQTAVQYFV